MPASCHPAAGAADAAFVEGAHCDIRAEQVFADLREVHVVIVV